jgi:hypothetical protein
MVQGVMFTTFIFFVTYEWAECATPLEYMKPERLARYKYSSLLGQFESYDENKVL